MPVNQGSGIRESGRVFGQGQKAAKTIRAGIYARVSTQDQQTLPMQNRATREYAARRCSVPPGYQRQVPVRRPKLGPWLGVIGWALPCLSQAPF